MLDIYSKNYSKMQKNTPASLQPNAIINGIVQGSGLGSTLYIIHESDFVLNSSINVLLEYVDDTNLLIPEETDISLSQRTWKQHLRDEFKNTRRPLTSSLEVCAAKLKFGSKRSFVTDDENESLKRRKTSVVGCISDLIIRRSKITAEATLEHLCEWLSFN